MNTTMKESNAVRTLPVRNVLVSLLVLLVGPISPSAVFAIPQVGSVTATIAVGPGPRGMALDPNSGHIYVTTADNTVVVIDGATNQLVGSPIPVGSLPEAIAFNPNNNYLYVANHFSGSVSVIDDTTNTVIATIGGMGYVNGLAFDPASGNIYVADDFNCGGNGCGAIRVINGLSLVGTRSVGYGPIGITADPVTGYLYSTSFQASSVYVIDGTTNTEVASIPVGFPQSGAVFNPANGYVYVYGGNPGVVWVIDPMTNLQVGSPISVGASAGAAAYNPDNQYIYVTDFVSNSVSVVDGSTSTVVGTIPVGGFPLQGAVYNPLNQSVYISNYNDGTVSVISAPADTTNPVVSASLVSVRKGGDDDSSQLFRVVFSATDNVGVTSTTATLNGIAVTNGQVVKLKLTKNGAQRVSTDDGRLQIAAPSFTLTVTAFDAADNSATATAVPVFVKNGKDDHTGKGDKHDKHDKHDKNDKNDGKKSDKDDKKK